MAKLHPHPYTFARAASAISRGAMDEESIELQRLDEVSAALREGDVVGGVLSFPVADGKAHYLVTSASPLTLQHIPFFDGYSIPAAHVRGLDKSDVLDELARNKRMRAFFAKRA